MAAAHTRAIGGIDEAFTPVSTISLIRVCTSPESGKFAQIAASFTSYAGRKRTQWMRNRPRASARYVTKSCFCPASGHGRSTQTNRAKRLPGYRSPRPWQIERTLFRRSPVSASTSIGMRECDQLRGAIRIRFRSATSFVCAGTLRGCACAGTANAHAAAIAAMLQEASARYMYGIHRPPPSDLEQTLQAASRYASRTSPKGPSARTAPRSSHRARAQNRSSISWS